MSGKNITVTIKKHYGFYIIMLASCLRCKWLMRTFANCPAYTIKTYGPVEIEVTHNVSSVLR